MYNCRLKLLASEFNQVKEECEKASIHLVKAKKVVRRSMDEK